MRRRTRSTKKIEAVVRRPTHFAKKEQSGCHTTGSLSRFCVKALQTTAPVSQKNHCCVGRRGQFTNYFVSALTQRTRFTKNIRSVSGLQGQFTNYFVSVLPQFTRFTKNIGLTHRKRSPLSIPGMERDGVRQSIYKLFCVWSDTIYLIYTKYWPHPTSPTV